MATQGKRLKLIFLAGFGIVVLIFQVLALDGVRYRLAGYYRDQGRYSDAEKWYQKIIRKNGNIERGEDFYRNYTEWQKSLLASAEGNLKQGEVTPAEKDFQQITNLYQKVVYTAKFITPPEKQTLADLAGAAGTAYAQLSHLAQKQNDLANAFQLCLTGAKIDPHPDFTRLAELAVRNNRVDQAVELFLEKKLTQLNLGDEPVALAIARSAWQMWSFPLSLSLFRDLVGRHPEKEAYAYELGLIQLKGGMPAEAFQSLIRLSGKAAGNPGDTIQTGWPDDFLGQAALNNFRNYESLDLFRRAIDKDPYRVESYIGLAQAHLNLGQQEEAKATYERLYQLAPPFPMNWKLPSGVTLTGYSYEPAEFRLGGYFRIVLFYHLDRPEGSRQTPKILSEPNGGQKVFLEDRVILVAMLPNLIFNPVVDIDPPGPGPASGWWRTLFDDPASEKTRLSVGADQNRIQLNNARTALVSCLGSKVTVSPQDVLLLALEVNSQSSEYGARVGVRCLNYRGIEMHSDWIVSDIRPGGDRQVRTCFTLPPQTTHLQLVLANLSFGQPASFSHMMLIKLPDPLASGGQSSGS
ncbi:MAG: tetratricopeptide repeat protein [Deltaproteobacteria bacterium]|nr:tetratricopeptide repeat protein [Deltaproteobacteria bacterium]